MKKQAVTFFLVFLVIGFLFGFSAVFAVGLHGADKTAASAGLTSYPDNIMEIKGGFIGTFLLFIAVFFFILMVYGGFIWMMARGNEEQEKKALRTVIAAVIGMTIIVSAYALTKLIFTRLNETDPKNDDSACIKKGEGWSCGSIDSCSGVTGQNIEEKRESCSQSSSCAINLCPGNDTIVCCQS